MRQLRRVRISPRQLCGAPPGLEPCEVLARCASGPTPAVARWHSHLCHLGRRLVHRVGILSFPPENTLFDVFLGDATSSKMAEETTFQVEVPIMDTLGRINSCRRFAGGHCPHQGLMERVYLIYQLFESEPLARAKALCWRCGKWSNRMSLVSGPRVRLECSNVLC